MKKVISFLLVVMIGFIVSGCATWHGIKQDSSQAWESTKKTIHNATR